MPDRLEREQAADRDQHDRNEPELAQPAGSCREAFDARAGALGERLRRRRDALGIGAAGCDVRHAARRCTPDAAPAICARRLSTSPPASVLRTHLGGELLGRAQPLAQRLFGFRTVVLSPAIARSAVSVAVTSSAIVAFSAPSSALSRLSWLLRRTQ